MKKFIFISTITILIMTNLSFSTSENNTIQLYIMCLKLHIEQSNVEGNNRHSLSDTINIIGNGIVGLPKSIDKYELRTIDDSISNIITNGSIHAIKLFPIEIENENLIITLSDYIISKNKNGLIFAYGGGRAFYFQYNCLKKKYVYLRSKTISF